MLMIHQRLKRSMYIAVGMGIVVFAIVSYGKTGFASLLVEAIGCAAVLAAPVLGKTGRTIPQRKEFGYFILLAGMLFLGGMIFTLFETLRCLEGVRAFSFAGSALIVAGLGILIEEFSFVLCAITSLGILCFAFGDICLGSAIAAATFANLYMRKPEMLPCLCALAVVCSLALVLTGQTLPEILDRDFGTSFTNLNAIPDNSLFG